MGAQFCPDCGLSGFVPRWGEGKKPARCMYCGWEGDLDKVVMFTPEKSFFDSVDERIRLKKEGKLFFLRVQNGAKDKQALCSSLRDFFKSKEVSECQNGDVLVYVSRKPSKLDLLNAGDIAFVTSIEVL